MYVFKESSCILLHILSIFIGLKSSYVFVIAKRIKFLSPEENGGLLLWR